MSLTLFHRTSIGDAREIVQNGFSDAKWRFEHEDKALGGSKKATGVWLSDRPLQSGEGPPGDATLEVVLEVQDEALELFQVDGVLWDARLWIVPAEVVNRHADIRILNVDPRSSWFHEKPDLDGEHSGGEDLPEDMGA
ncbi:MAG TPA: hypothetical protein VGA22_10265 [Gemmatimonadales bacterium]|jgi:hypothetical protein